LLGASGMDDGVESHQNVPLMTIGTIVLGLSSDSMNE
jgi:hypothetical protein